MNKTVVTKSGKVVSLCSYRFVNPDGRVDECHSHAACPVCGQCSRIDGEHERGHCTGHLGLNEHIAVPGSDAMAKERREQR